MLPLPDEARQQIGQLRELHLQLALGTSRTLSEDVQDQRGAIDDLDAERLAEIALLDRRERIVGDEEVGAALAHRLGHLVDLAAAEVERRRRGLPLLDHALADGGAGRRGQSRQLLE